MFFCGINTIYTCICKLKLVLIIFTDFFKANINVTYMTKKLETKI